MKLHLDLLPGTLAICRLPAAADSPAWARGELVAVTRTATELSVVCAEAAVPTAVRAEPGWRALRVRGPLPFDVVGVVAALARPLAAAGVPIFVISTFDTDYVLVKATDLPRAEAALRSTGCDCESKPGDSPDPDRVVMTMATLAAGPAGEGDQP